MLSLLKNIFLQLSREEEDNATSRKLRRILPPAGTGELHVAGFVKLNKK